MALERNRFNAMALVNKGNVLFLQDDIGLARECYQEAVNVHSTCPEAIYNLGLSYIRLGRDKDAMDVFENLLTISPNDPSVLYQVACICERQQNWAMALKWLNILSTRVPADATTKMKFDTLMDKLGTE
jgi:intraflagellar transport protein 88